MTKFVNIDQARKSLLDNKFLKPKDPLLEDVATIAAFLCNNDQFESELEKVSTSMWDHYRGLDPAVKNKFSRSLAFVASKAGFRVDDGKASDTGNSGLISKEPVAIKLIGSDKVFVDMLEAGLFWKDSMNLRHGEYTHALQWLAIQSKYPALALKVYKVTGKLKSSNGVVLWSWLADCFPNNAAGGDELVSSYTKETLKSETYRSPQKITDYLIGKPGGIENHFVSQWLYCTYTRRNLLSFEKPSEKKLKYEPNATAAPHYKDLKGASPDWATRGDWMQADGNPNRLLRSYGPMPKHVKVDASKQEGRLEGFHGLPGQFYA